MRQIYIAEVKNRPYGNYKVGLSKNPSFRMKQLKIDQCMDCEIVFTVDAPQDIDVELAIHKELRPYRSPHANKWCREWYQADYGAIKECVIRAVRDFHTINKEQGQ